MRIGDSYSMLCESLAMLGSAGATVRAWEGGIPCMKCDSVVWGSAEKVQGRWFGDRVHGTHVDHFPN